jgi:hypothetical protein
MPIENIDLEIDQYADFVITYFFLASGGSLPVNLTGYTAQLMIRNTPTDATPIVSISTTPNAQGSIVLGGAAGSVAVSINHATTATLVGNSLMGHDILLTAPGGQVISFLHGRVFVTAGNAH